MTKNLLKEVVELVKSEESIVELLSGDANNIKNNSDISNLDTNNTITQLNVYLGDTRNDIKFGESNTWQEIVFETYVDINTDANDFLVSYIYNKVDEFFKKDIENYHVTFSYGAPLKKVPSGIVGYKLVYSFFEKV